MSGHTEICEPITVINRTVLPVDAPARILISPWGEVRSTGGDYIMDDLAAAAIAAAFAEHGADLPIDYEHATLGGEWATPTGVAPAMGWIKSMEAVPGQGLYANVEWTEPGAEYVRTKQYRYLSPVIMVRKSDRRAVALHSVALTNKPAIVDMTPIVNRQPPGDPARSVNMDPKFESARWFLNLEATATEQQIMDEMQKFLAQLRELLGLPATADQAGVIAGFKAKLDAAKSPKVSAAVCKALSLAETAGEAEVVEAINRLGRPLPPITSRAVICSALNLPHTAGDDQIIAAINSAKAAEPNPAEFVPMSIHKPLLDRVSALEAEQVTNKAAAFIASAISAGKICKAEEDHWLWAYKANPQQATADMDKKPAGKFPADGQAVHASANSATPANGDRAGIIAKAAAEFQANRESLSKITDRTSFVSGELIQAGQKPLSKDEADKIGA